MFAHVQCECKFFDFEVSTLTWVYLFGMAWYRCIIDSGDCVLSTVEVALIIVSACRQPIIYDNNLIK